MAKLPPIGEMPLVPLLLTEAEAYSQWINDLGGEGFFDIIRSII